MEKPTPPNNENFRGGRLPRGSGVLTGTVEKMGFIGAVLFLIFLSALFGFGWTMGKTVALSLYGGN